MPAKSWTLTDVPTGVYVPEIDLGPELGPNRCSIKKRRLQGGLSDGVDAITVDNGTIRFTVLPTRGMSLWKAWRGDMEIGWKSPVHGPVHPSHVPLMEPSGLGWLDGFDELLVRCGLESNGAPDFDAATGRLTYPLHGRIGNKPAYKVEVAVDAEGEITVLGMVEETRFHFSKLRLTSIYRTRPGENGVRIHDEVENLSATSAGMQLLYHINFGPPLLDAGARVVAPAKTVVPRTELAARNINTWDSYGADTPGAEEQVYFFEVAGNARQETRVLLKNAHATAGVGLGYNTRQLPCFTIWKNPAALKDGYVTGLEPGTNFPNPRSHELAEKRVVSLAPGAKQEFDLNLELLATANEVATAEKAVASLASGITPNLHKAPQPGWCAGVK